MESKMQDKSARVNDRLYQDLARKLIVELKEGKYPVGGRLPAERELAQQYDVSRPTVREAIIALEVQGFGATSTVAPVSTRAASQGPNGPEYAPV